MIENLLQLGGGRLLIPIIVVVVGVAIVKGAFNLTRSRSADRRDFLELFQKYQDANDLWLSVAVRHLFGAYLPAGLIRQLMSAQQPGRALLEVSNSWDLLDLNDETGDLYWRRKILRSQKVRKRIILVFTIFYFVLAFISLTLAYHAMVGTFEGLTLWVAWAWTILTAFGAFSCLAYGDTLKEADKAARRWLGMS